MNLIRRQPRLVLLLAFFVTTATTRGGSAAFLSSRFALRTNNKKTKELIMEMTTPPMAATDVWSPLDPESLCSAPCLIEQTLCVEPDDDRGTGQSSSSSPRLARDKSYAVAVMDAWRHDEAEANDGDANMPWAAEYKRVVYFGSESDRDCTHPLYGFLVRRQQQSDGADGAGETELPGVLLFHTAAGPNDIFLLYKAAQLVNTLEGGCVVMVADLLSDGMGWGWNSDKTRYQAQSEHLLQTVNGSGRPVLQDRIRAAIDCMASDPDLRVDRHRLAALGWCFGGHAIQELGRVPESPDFSVRAMATFHGVFDSAAVPPPSSAPPPQPRACEVLLCTGTDDPFVSSDMVEAALQGLQDARHTVSLLQLKGARHGFSNPGQQHNANQASFGYDDAAARKSWRQTMALLHRRLVRK